MHVLLSKSFICIAVVSCVVSLLVLEADRYITETSSSTEELIVYVSKSWHSWDPLQ